MLFRQHAKGSIKAASSLETLSNTGTIPPISKTCLGIKRYSAKPPLIVEPISFRFIHKLYFLLLQYQHSKQGIIGYMDTLVLGLILTFFPWYSSTISAQISCPNIIGGVTLKWPFLNVLTS